MAPPRQVQDPFTDAPLRPTTSNATNSSLRNQNSQQSLRSNASSASTRTRPQQRDLFAPALSRKPTSRTTPRIEDEVLADSDSERELAGQRYGQMRRVRHGSPESKSSRLKAKQDEEPEFVNRRADGTYLLGVAGFGDAVAVPQMSMPKTDEEMNQDEVDAHYVGISRQFFASGASLGGRSSSKKHEEELEQLRVPMMMRLREQVMQKLEDERWQYEPSRRFQPHIS